MKERFIGVIEGFYGPVWSMEERKAFLRWMGNEGFNAYIYAPKADPYHRERWREPYPAEGMRTFHELLRVGGEEGIEVMMAISPGLSLVYSDPRELDTLWEKVKPFLALGVKHLGLFFDDIPFELKHEEDRRRYQSLAAAQADFTLRLLEMGKEEDLRLLLCPTYYAGGPDHPYLLELGRQLPEEVDLFWTGPAICSPAISAEHLRAVEKAMERKPLIWDNYPVNDAMMEPELHIGPYRGRDRSLIAGSRGVFLNPMRLSVASRIPLATAARFFSDPEGYDPDRVWEEAAKEELERNRIVPASVEKASVSDRDAEEASLLLAFQSFAEAVTITPLTPDEPPAYLSFVQQFQTLLSTGRREEAAAHYIAQLQGMKRAYETLRGKEKDLPLLQEISPWIKDFGRWATALEEGFALLTALVHLESLSEEEEKEGAKRQAAQAFEALKARLEESVSWPTATCGDTLRVFLQRLLRSSRPFLGMPDVL